jgi:hypothetical protein
MDLRTYGAQLLGHEPPAGRRFQRDLERLADEVPQELANIFAVGWRDTRPADLAGDGVDPLGRDCARC